MNTLSLTVLVKAKREEAKDIAGFTLVDPHGRELPTFTAGAHIDVLTGNGIIRQYSLCNSSTDTHEYRIGVLREVDSRGGSVAMHDSINEGDFIQISAPRNQFPLAEQASKSLLLAGGIGVTPLLAMAEKLSADGADFELHYCTRSEERAAFIDRLEQPDLADKVHFHFDDEPATKLDMDALVSQKNDDAHLYVCGPGGFIDFVMGRFKEAGWHDSQLHTEYFTAAAPDTENNSQFEIEIASTGDVFTVAKNETITDVLIDNDYDILTSCEQGICGTCVMKILDGIPEHHDQYLTAEEKASNKLFTPCCSRAKSARLVLDL